MPKIKLKKKESVFFSLVVLLFLFSSWVFAETARLPPSKSIVLNEFAPDVVPASLDYYVGTFEAEKDGIKNKYIARTLLFFDINEINDIKNKHISNAYIELNAIKGHDFISDAELEISVHNGLERWATATWNNQPEFDDNMLSKTIISGDGEYITNIKDIVKEWASNPSINYGILIKGIDEDKAKVPNLKQIESISLVVEYENINECNRNNGVCRKECGDDESETTISCGFFSGNKCCLKGREIITTTTIPSATLPSLQTDRFLETIQAKKCNDGTLDGFCSAKSSNRNKLLSCKDGFLVDDNSCTLISRRINNVNVKIASRDRVTIEDNNIECKGCSIFTEDSYETSYLHLTGSKLQIGRDGKNKAIEGIGTATIHSKKDGVIHDVVLHKPEFSPVIPVGTIIHGVSPDELFDAAKKSSSIKEMVEYLQGKKGKGKVAIQHNKNEDKIIGEDAIVTTKHEDLDCEEDEEGHEEDEEKNPVEITAVFDKKNTNGKTGMEEAKEHIESFASPAKEHGEGEVHVEGAEISGLQKSMAITLASVIPATLEKLNIPSEAELEKDVGIDIGKDRLYFSISGGIKPRYTTLAQHILGGVKVTNNLKQYIGVSADISVKYEPCPKTGDIKLNFRPIEYLNGKNIFESIGAEAELGKIRLLGQPIILSVIKERFNDYDITYTLRARKTEFGVGFNLEERGLITGALITREIGEILGIPTKLSFIFGEVEIGEEDGH